MKIMLQQSKDNRGIGAAKVADIVGQNRTDPSLELLSLKTSLVRVRERQPWQVLVRTAQDRRKGVG
ncbi:hypothetical protein [Rhodoferax sp.]|uniref:hypothetical protein n=1 Tax=Rhodoferax sp. TaxID=50421 RepID=UPI0025FF55FB|nr:hypothetical protein [Rhodoferax sp.]